MANQTGETSSTCILSRVCEACRSGPFAVDSFRQAIVTNPEDSKGGFSYTTTCGEIKKSVDEGCKWCTLLAFAKRTRPGTAFASEPPEKVVEVRLRVDVVTMGYGNILWLFIDSIPFGAFDIYADHGDKAAEHIGTGGLLRGEILFPDYKKASEWIDKCPDHEFCQKPEEVILPTRVIDCSQPEKPKLLITEGLPRGHYAALSYVWGRKVLQPQKTTTKNVDSYVKGINVPLPQTIVDAIVVTHKLKLRYLWVDSLCILQDSKDDRDKAMAQMAKIYGNAKVTIAAASAYASNEGFLEQPTFRLPFQCPDGNVGSMLVQHRVSLERAIGYGSDGIETRAWCFQERVLSPRLLFFSGPFLLTYLCRSVFQFKVSDTLDVPIEQPDPTYARWLFPNISLSDDQSPSDDELSHLRTLWYQILGDYSGRGMSRPSDKLVAIAGVVEAFNRVWHYACIAGLWEQTLIDDLFWRRIVDSDSPLLPRPDKYRAPSWSWAAINGKIESHRDHFTGIPSIAYKCEILECKTTPTCDRLPWGEVTGGILRINAKMKEVTWDPINGNLVEPGSLWNGTVGTSADHSTRSKDQVYPDSKEEVTESKGKVWLVLLRLGMTPSSGEPWAHGLFVVPDDEKDRYRRVGTLRCLRVPDWYETTPREEITIV